MDQLMRLEVAKNLNRCRDTARRILEETYDEVVKPYVDILEKEMKDSNIDVTAAFINVCERKDVEGDGPLVLMFSAATVEIMLKPETATLSLEG